MSIFPQGEAILAQVPLICRFKPSALDHPSSACFVSLITLSCFDRIVMHKQTQLIMLCLNPFTAIVTSDYSRHVSRGIATVPFGISPEIHGVHVNFRLLGGYMGVWESCTISRDNRRCICSTSDVLANRRNIHYSSALLWRFRDSGSGYKTADLPTYLLLIGLCSAFCFVVYI